MRTCDIEHCDNEARYFIHLHRIRSWWFDLSTIVTQRKYLCDVHHKRALTVLRDQFSNIFGVADK